MPGAILTIPCHNEEARLSPDEIRRLLGDPRVSLVLVDDGSTDRTRELLESLARANPGRVDVVAYDVNRGKAEAVRGGILRALERSAGIVGFADADFATPSFEILHLLDGLEGGRVQDVFASRVARLGANIDRSPSRHYLGRAFATLAALTLGAAVYDTQCGAKWFRVNDATRAAFSEPFTTRWAFDVELLGRLIGRFPVARPASPISVDEILELPVTTWRDVKGSKLRLSGMVSALGELAMLAARSRR